MYENSGYSINVPEVIDDRIVQADENSFQYSDELQGVSGDLTINYIEQMCSSVNSDEQFK